MNINKPNISRQLAAMIQGIDGDERDKFIEDAKNAKSMEAFINKFTHTNYGNKAS